jgi:hypothetical protein
MAIQKTTICDLCGKHLQDKDTYYKTAPEMYQHSTWRSSYWYKKLNTYHVCESCFDDKFTTQNNLSETKENKSPYTPIGTVKTFGNPKTELRDDAVVIAVTLIILSLVMLMLSCFN